MKKIIFCVFVSSFLLMSCSGLTELDKRLPTKEELVGSWSCRTTYENLGVGIVDLIKLNADGSLYDESYIFDNSMDIIINKPTKDYFSAPFRYLQINSGSWKLEGNHLTHSIIPRHTTRLIFPNVFAKVQETDFIKDYEAKLFAIYSSNKADKVELDFIGFTKNGFIVNQILGESTYKSYCKQKDKTVYKFNQRLEKYKKVLGN